MADPQSHLIPFLRLLMSQEGSDFVIRVKDFDFTVHRFIIMAVSSMLRAVYDKKFKVSAHVPVKSMTNVDPGGASGALARCRSRRIADWVAR
jgi:hypothetical protein